MRNLSKTYGEGETEVRALQNVSFSVERGEVLLIVGSSGSGKSTLLNMIGLLDRPTSGRVLIDGVDTSDLDDNQMSAIRNSKLGFVFQFSNLLPDLSVLENVMLPCEIQSSDGGSAGDARELLRAVGLESQMHRRANKISGGQSQRAAIARSLANRPAVVLADEPTGNLDSVTAGKIVELIRSMAERLGQTFIIVTHDRHQFGNVDRIITIKDGRSFEGQEPPIMEAAAQ